MKTHEPTLVLKSKFLYRCWRTTGETPDEVDEFADMVGGEDRSADDDESQVGDIGFCFVNC
jgi:hypothetical protein